MIHSRSPDNALIQSTSGMSRANFSERWTTSWRSFGGSDAVVEKELHAASWFSNSTASRTALTFTSYHRATRSTDVVRNAAARIAVGTHDFITTACPKLRAGS